MPWVYLDDGFDEHPKVEAAGGDAGWLYVVALCFARRNRTAGAIPKSKVARLTDRRGSQRLAARLVEVGLWEDHGGHYQIHDYERWNQTEAREKQARKAAEARWAGHAPGIAVSNTSGTPSGIAVSNAPPMPRTRVPQSPVPSPQSPVPSSDVCTNSSSSYTGSIDDDDRAEPTLWEATAGIAIARLAQIDLERREAKAGPVGNPESWLTTARERRANQHADQLRDLDLDQYRNRIPDLVKLLEPNGQRSTNRGPMADALDTTLAAQHRAYDLAHQRRQRPCPDCDGVMRVETEPGVWAPCPTCQATGIAPQEAAR